MSSSAVLSSDYMYFLKLKQASDSASMRDQYQRSNRKGSFERLTKRDPGLHHDHVSAPTPVARPSRPRIVAMPDNGRQRHGC